MLKNILFVLSALAVARAQIPSIGRCPEYVPMTNFDMSKFLGVWYVADRYFQILDPASRCVMANYTENMGGKYRVSNQVTNRFTGIKRVVEGEIRTPTTKAEEGKLLVKYTALPLTPEIEYSVLETDYDDFAVMWSCSRSGPFNAQNAWVMTRARRPEGPIIQKAYGVLDKYKISKNYFIKTDQEDCAWPDEVPTIPKPSENSVPEAPVEVAEVDKEKEVNMRSAIVLEEEAADEEEIAQPSSIVPDPEKVVVTEPQIVKQIDVPSKEIEKNINHPENAGEPVEIPPSSVPEVILKAADRAKEIVKKTIDDVKAFEPIKAIKESFEKPAEKLQEALANPVERIQEALAKPIEQIKETFEKPYEQIKETFEKPYEQIKETFEKPYEQIKETFEKPYEQIKETIQGPADRIKEILTAPPLASTETSAEKSAESKEPIVNETKETSEAKIES